MENDYVSKGQQMKPKLLFVDDSWKRIQYALEEYGKTYDVVIAPSAKEALRQLVGEDFAVVSLDHDLMGQDFQDPDSLTCGMEIVRYIGKTGWPSLRHRPRFWIHSSNIFAAKVMIEELLNMDFEATGVPLWWKKYQHGVVAGAFDVIHPGYVYLLKEAKDLCHKVTVLIHDKPNQVFDLQTRTEILLALKYVDDVIPYGTEEELTVLLERIEPDVRIVGSDHQDVTTRPLLQIKTVYHTRDHDWSATRYKRMITEAYRE
jgi:glycerol-3-phosphate cytidylyltransferase